MIKFIYKENIKIKYFDNYYFVSFINRVYFIKAYLKLTINNITSFIIVRNVKSNKHRISKYVIISLYLSSMFDDKKL